VTGQLILELSPAAPPTFDNFVAGANGAAVAAVRAAVRGDGERAVYLWGDAGSGRSHLVAAAARMPLLERAGIARRWAGLYEITPDHHPILGPVAELEGFYCNAGFSGHGFMHSPAAGLLLAEEIVDGRAHSLDITSLRLERFGRGNSSARRS
jgi:sarcosine oxidase subunit beta